MGSIRWTSDPVSSSTKDTEFIRCVDGWEPQIHKLWSLGLDNIIHKVHPAVQVEVGTGPMGEFMTNHLAENGRKIPIT